MKDRRPAPPRTQHRRSHSRTSTTAALPPLAEHFPRLIRAACSGLLSAVLFCILGSLAATAFLATLPDPCTPLPAVAIAVLLLGSLVGAGVAGKTGGGRVLLCGGMTGALLLLMMFLATSLLPGQKDLFSPGVTLLLRGAVVLFCCFGAYFGARLPERRTGKRR